MCKRDTESVKVAPESVLSNRGNLEGTHLTRFSPGGGLSPGGLSPHTSVSDNEGFRRWSSWTSPSINYIVEITKQKFRTEMLLQLTGANWWN